MNPASTETAPAESRSPLSRLTAALDLSEGETLDRAYVFEPLERKDVSFRLALVTKRLDGERLEMIALGARSGAAEEIEHDFVRRARFPDTLLAEILIEFIDRCGAEGSLYREVALHDPSADPRPPIERLAELLYPAANGM